MSATVPAVVRQELAQRRQAGEPFDGAWEAAVASVRGRERDAWLVALHGTRDAWLRAYAGEPLTRAEQAVSLVGTDREPLSSARCKTCRGPLPESGRGGRKFCSERCRRASYR